MVSSEDMNQNDTKDSFAIKQTRVVSNRERHCGISRAHETSYWRKQKAGSFRLLAWWRAKKHKLDNFH